MDYPTIELYLDHLRGLWHRRDNSRDDLLRIANQWWAVRIGRPTPTNKSNCVGLGMSIWLDMEILDYYARLCQDIPFEELFPPILPEWCRLFVRLKRLTLQELRNIETQEEVHRLPSVIRRSVLLSFHCEADRFIKDLPDYQAEYEKLVSEKLAKAL